MFVWHRNSGKLLVNERGRVKDENHVDIQPKYDTDGYKYVKVGHTRYYVHELVIQNHGKPPHKNRLPKKGEVVIFKDGDKTNCEIDNLEYAEKDNDGTFRRPEGVPEAVEEYVWQLLKQGKTYNQIQEAVAVSNYEQRTISIGKIADIRAERSEKANAGEEQLKPSERQSLEAIKKQLGETDDNAAKRQKLAKQEAEAKSKEVEKEKKEAEEQAAKEAERFSKSHSGGGWYKVYDEGTDVTEKHLDDDISFKKDQAAEVLEAFQTDEQDGIDLIVDIYESRKS